MTATAVDRRTGMLRSMAQGVRTHGAALLAGVPDPHDELLALVWGPRFDRVHALGLAARGPLALAALPGVLAAADCFDTLGAVQQRRLRGMILRHRALARA